MKITIESTTKLVELNGVPARVWEGVSDGGVPIHCFITRIAVATSLGQDAHERFMAELIKQRQPSALISEYPARMIL
jgi:hypothetical protein